MDVAVSIEYLVANNCLQAAVLHVEGIFWHVVQLNLFDCLGGRHKADFSAAIFVQIGPVGKASENSAAHEVALVRHVVAQ